MGNKALFLDRDGVINHDPGDYTKNLSEFQILPTVLEALVLAHNGGYKIILITNQGGIAKGLYTHQEVTEIHDYLKKEVTAIGAQIDDIFYSPHHPEVGNSLNRKPKSLMIERALHRYNLDPNLCVMIGDKERDIECASRAGVRGILIPTNAPLLEYVKRLEPK